MSESAWKVVRLGGLITGLVTVGTLGFHLIEGWDLFDSLWMSMITLTTVGYGEVHPMTRAGRAFTMFFLMAGLGIFLYGIVQVAELMVKAQFREWLGKRKLGSKIKSMRAHYIICGFGRMGQSVAEQLAEKNMEFIVIDKDPSRVAECTARGWHGTTGDATDDATLAMAGIDRARGVACVMENDADNLFVVLSARLLNPQIQIIARANDERGIEKMQRAGANRVVCMYTAAGSKIAQLLSNPNIEDFFQVVSGTHKDLSLTEFAVDDTSRYRDRPLSETDFRSRGIMIVGIRKADGSLSLPPDASEIIRAGDSLLALSRNHEVRDFTN